MDKIISRDIYLKKILPFLGKPIVKVITGMRRTGKSTLIKTIAGRLVHEGTPENNILVINKESLAFDFIRTHSDLYSYCTEYFTSLQGEKYLFIDEIQEITNWEKAVASFLSDNTADLTISGSNARMLSSELATLLTGRYVEIPVYPLTYAEFLQFRRTILPTIDLENEFQRFLKYGGFPGLHLIEFDDESTYLYLNSLFSTILLKDVVNRHEIREPAQLENITRFIFDNCGNITTAKRISNYLRSQKIPVSVERVQNYLLYLTNAYLIYKVSRYDLKGLKHLELYEKYYMGDIGLRHGLIGYRDKDIDGVLENIVFLELLTRGYKVSIGKLADNEVDFIAEKQHEKIYIQVCYLLASQETIQREFGVLERIHDNYPKIVLSMDKHFINDIAGIQRQNIIDFLTSQWSM